MIVTLNSGSSSLKFGVTDGRSRVLSGAVTAIGHGGEVSATGRHADRLLENRPAVDADHHQTLDWLLSHLAETLAEAPSAVGHRIVHGGVDFQRSTRLGPEQLDRLQALACLAPGHQPYNLAGVEAAQRIWPDAAQIGCFDTAFHRTQDRIAQLFALPADYERRGIIRYGFHGLSYEYISGVMPEIIGRAAEGRVIVAHLGHGASLCAMQNGRSVATTMGFTALDGLPMGTRSGSIDPGVILYLLQQDGMSPDALADLLYKKSGLLGLSGIGSDMRRLRQSSAPEAETAIAYSVDRCVRAIGEMTAALGGLDALIFTAGIGEHDAQFRAAVIDRLGYLGMRLDAYANAKHRPCLTANETGPAAWVIATDEEAVIARDCHRLAPQQSGA